MAKTWAMALVAAYILAAGTGCAMYLAQKGHPGTNLDALRVGTSEQEVENQLGTPSTNEVLGAGKRRTVYRIELTKQPNRLRAGTHFVLDYATLGIWELPATIYELHQEHRMGEVGFVYGPDGRILEIQNDQATQVMSLHELQVQTSSFQGFWDAVNK
jgi:hypothetical protein